MKNATNKTPDGIGTRILKFVRNMVIATFLVCLITALVCWVAGWRTVGKLGDGITYAGVAVVVLSVFMLLGGSNSRADDIEAFSISGAGNMGDHLQRHLQSTLSSYGFVIAMVAAGACVLFVGWLLQSAR